MSDPDDDIDRMMVLTCGAVLMFACMVLIIIAAAIVLALR